MLNFACPGQFQTNPYLAVVEENGSILYMSPIVLFVFVIGIVHIIFGMFMLLNPLHITMFLKKQYGLFILCAGFVLLTISFSYNSHRVQNDYRIAPCRVCSAKVDSASVSYRPIFNISTRYNGKDHFIQTCYSSECSQVSESNAQTMTKEFPTDKEIICYFAPSIPNVIYPSDTPPFVTQIPLIISIICLILVGFPLLVQVAFSSLSYILTKYENRANNDPYFTQKTKKLN